MTEQEWNEFYPDFSLEEIYSPSAHKRLLETGVHIINFDLMDKVQHLRNITGALFVNQGEHRRRGVRTPKDNYELYSELGQNPFSFSFHIAGLALDISSNIFTPLQLLDIIVDADVPFHRAKVYKTWLHVDDAPTNSTKLLII